jgi:splicing factor 1
MDIFSAVEESAKKPSTQRVTRWAPFSQNDAGVTGFPTAITSPMTSEQLDAYVAAFRIEEITQALRAGNVVPPSNWNRAPEPEPEYDSSGRRTNTTQQRYRRHLEDERHRLVEHAMKSIPNYRAPYDYHRPTRFTEKVYVPVEDYPHVNFIGQILGPRGNSLKAMNAESGANIVLCGRGLVKEGRRTGRFGGQVDGTNNN